MRIALLLSGGVDSSVALHLLQREKTYRIDAYYIKVWSEDDVHFLGNCPWEDDLHYAKLVCAKYHVPLKIISLQQEYRKTVIAYTLDSLTHGRTPSPDIFCNKHIKFGAFYDAIRGAYDFIASGHYATVVHSPRYSTLKCAKDGIKDQTYFLTHLSQKQLRRLIFPLGAYTKNTIRKIALRVNLPNAGRPDSQGLCFLGSIKYNDFIANYLQTRAGDIVDIATQMPIGTHRGHWYYTVGQRQGLRLANGPWYVLRKDPKNNVVYVTKNNQLLDTNTFTITHLNLNIPKPLRSILNKNLAIKIRHSPEKHRCTLRSISNSSIAVHVSKAVHAPAPGQLVALYDKNICIGGAVIADKAWAH